MRYGPLLPILGYAFFHASHAFEFTGPDSSQKLNLTQTITITWDFNNGPVIEPEARALDLWFNTRSTDINEWFTWLLATNLSLTAGSYTWDPETVVKSLKDSNFSIRADAVHAFEARLLNNSGSKLSSVQSDVYAVEGFGFIRNSAGKGAQVGFYTAVVAFTVACLAHL
ncbi:hypothetical protein FGLOB1_12255 [Fusarium globosum]|uniref:Uncharacterized protein n=1 Tax=Fusarium globosum TaxID=78864 RepID=A0A8H5XRJ9_9HYPO|nr:hypothetical protein FGLOB1_12255 [Fusarium globosum]